MLSPCDALSDVVRVLPTFKGYWDAENSYRDASGKYSVCGVYLTLTWFLREYWQTLTEKDWNGLALLASDHHQRVEDPASTFGACLIEGLEGEEFSPLVARYFDRELLHSFGFVV